MTEEERLFHAAARHHQWRTQRKPYPASKKRRGACSPGLLRRYRYQAGLYCYQAAERLGISTSTYTKWELGDVGIPYKPSEIAARFGLTERTTP